MLLAARGVNLRYVGTTLVFFAQELFFSLWAAFLHSSSRYGGGALAAQVCDNRLPRVNTPACHGFELTFSQWCDTTRGTALFPRPESRARPNFLTRRRFLGENSTFRSVQWWNSAWRRPGATTTRLLAVSLSMMILGVWQRAAAEWIMREEGDENS